MVRSVCEVVTQPSLKTCLHIHDSEVAGFAPQTLKKCVHSKSKSAAKLPCVKAIGLEYEQVVYVRKCCS